MLLWYNDAVNGALAQLGAHHTGSVGVRGSNPLCSTRTEPVPPFKGAFVLLVDFVGSCRSAFAHGSHFLSGLYIIIRAMKAFLRYEGTLVYLSVLSDRKIFSEIGESFSVPVTLSSK